MEVFFHARFFRRVELVPAPLFLAKWLHHAMPSPRGAVASLACRMPCCLTSRAMAISFLRRSPVPPPKPSPRGEDAELCSPDAVLPDVTRHGNFVSAPLTGATPQAFSPRRRCRTLFAGCGGSVPSPSSAFRRLPHFQSSMLLHNLSSVFSLGRKASQRARRGSRVPHQRPPRRARPQVHTKPHPAAAPHRPHSPQRQVFHRVFHIFAGFPQRLSFPLAFLERDSVRSSEPWVLPAA